MDNTVNGIDVSRYQGNVDWQAVKAAGISYAFARATVGNTITDPQFRTNWRGMKAASILRGTYHVVWPDVDAKKQIQFFTGVVGSVLGDLPTVLDLELDRGMSNSVIVERCYACLQEMERLIVRKPIIYTSAGFWNTRMVVNGEYPAWASSYDLWVANYRTDPPPTLPYGWDTWKFWQWSSSGSVPGIQGKVDLDYFNGTTEELAAYAGLQTQPDTLLGKARVIADPKINVRSSPAILSNNDIGDLNYGAILAVLEIRLDGNDLWYRIGGPNLWVAARYQGTTLVEWMG